ncbi:MAG TPA: prepilin-type N-terminal cleavage/methylation domain-containing protein [Thermoanaerobaculia bacterium]|nr:prepilin-type N-terminal cleavage/methylation domain-containing protein [Thermoanaerobaculia bacterium]
MNRRVAGYTLMEVVVAMAVFGIFLMILGVLTVEMRSQEKRMPVNFMRHPQIAVVVTKLRRDVQDAFGANPYPQSFKEYTQSSQTLIVQAVQETGGVQTIVWDFREPRVERRRADGLDVARIAGRVLELVQARSGRHPGTAVGRAHQRERWRGTRCDRSDPPAARARIASAGSRSSPRSCSPSSTSRSSSCC